MESDGWIFVVLGFFGALLTSTSWVPQVFKAFRTKRLGDLSWLTLTVFGSGTLCWLFYGIYREDWLIIGANAFITVNISTLLFLKLLYRRAD